MRKVRMVLEDLSVESFDTTPREPGGRGTVHGQGIVGAIGEPVPYSAPQCGSYPNCPSPLCVDTPLASCDGSCAYTCGDSCNGTCNSCVSCNSCADTCQATCGFCQPPPDNHAYATK